MPHPGLSQISLTPVRPEPVVSLKKPQILMLSVAVAAALSACAKKEEAAPVADAAKPAEATAYKLDESKLPGVNRFNIADLDPTKNACTDFGGYVNGKWLAANPIPGDRTSWGAFEMLDERSHRRAAPARRAGRRRCRRPPAWRRSSATSGPPAWTRPRSTRRASSRSRPTWPRSTRSTARRSIAEYLRTSAAKGENVAVRLRSGSRLQGFHDQHRLRLAGWPGPAGQALLLRRRQEAQAGARTSSTSPRCWS